VPVIIDSVAPTILVEQAAWSGDTYRVPAFDSVSGQQLQYAFGRPGQGQETGWTSGGTIELSRDVAEAYRDDHGQVAVFVRDEAGNTASAVLVPLAQAPVGCSVGGGAGGGLLLGVVGLLLVGRPRHRRRSRRAV